MFRVALRNIVLLFPTLLLGTGLAAAQTGAPTAVWTAPPAQNQNPETEKSTRKPARRPPAGRVTVVPSQYPVAPQVVTVIHRLSGVKILRFILRQAGESGVVETIDPDSVNDDAHASIIAGWTLDDGKTIAARLPQAAAEIESREFEGPPPDQKSLFASTPFPSLRFRVEPDLTVVTRDGRKLRARLIGLDAETGLSVMQVAGGLPPLPQPAQTRALTPGQSLQIFAPEPIKPDGESMVLNTIVRVGRIDATVATTETQSPDQFEKLIVRAGHLSPDVIGGVLCDPAGNTVGIVGSISGDDATILSVDTVRAATRRVLERQASVPRPVLGVRGQFVEPAARAEFLAHGWRNDQLDDLISAGKGILLLSVMPKTPAALAKLRAGDVITQVNQKEVKSAEQFSVLLGQAGSGEQVQFTVKRPDAAEPFSVPVTLGGSFAPAFEWRFEMPQIKPAGLQVFGIETMALMPKVAWQLGAEGGLIVVAVRPDSPAANAGVREGDVIESVDGRLADRSIWIPPPPPPARQKKYVLGIVRGREKKKVVVEATD